MIPLSKETIDNLFEPRRAIRTAAELEAATGRLLTNGKMEAAKTLLAGGTPPKDVAQTLGVSVPTLYRWLPAAERA